ncbi:MAG TPA: hypothetical protein VF196_00455 [Casimicrobiaceae bacterium]
MLRAALVSCLCLFGCFATCASASAAEDWRQKRWYGWITVSEVGHEGSREQSTLGEDTLHRIRVRRSKARIVAAWGTAYSASGEPTDEFGNPSCQVSSSWRILGPGASLPFGNSLEIGRAGGASGYKLDLFHLSARTRETVTTNPQGCSPESVTARTYDAAYGKSIGCGVNVGCRARDRSHLRGATSYRTTFTAGSHLLTAAWDLVDDPDEDPCRTVPDRCLDDGTGDLAVTAAATGAQGDLGAGCGTATFDWLAVTGRPRTVRAGEQACVFLVGNAATRKLLTTASTVGVSLGSAFAGTVLSAGAVRYTGSVGIWAEKQLARSTILRALARSVGANATRFSPITAVGTGVGLLAVPLAGAFVLNEIKNGNACLQVIVDRDGGSIKADWSMVYARATDPMLSQSKVYRRIDKFLAVDPVEAVPLGMTCDPDGTVRVSGRPTAALTREVTTLLRRD